MRNFAKEVFVLFMLFNAIQRSWQWDVQVWTFPVPAKCITDNDCLKGEAKCLRGECHCNNPVSRGDGFQSCETSDWYKCKPHLEKHCHSSPLYANSHCIWSFRYDESILFCKCNEGHFGRAGVIGCLKAQDDPDGKRPCLGDQYCPPLSFCNSKTQRCQCKHGLVGNGVTCRPAPGRTGCKSNADCERWAVCKDSTCQCAYELQGDGKTCNQAPRKKCKTKNDCHAFANCMNGHCVCVNTAGNGQYCRQRWTPCLRNSYNRCGLYDRCVVDPIHKDHYWCLCTVGTDENGKCVECFTDKDCQRDAYFTGECVRNKCKCKEDLIFGHSRCSPNHNHPLCKTDRHCHPRAKCDEGRCICQGRTVGNGAFCRDAKDCPKNWRGTCKKFGNFGECLGDPLIRLGNGECKCYKGYYDHFPKGCIECKNNAECASSAYCQRYVCKCKDELIKNGKSCLAAPLHNCKTTSECHPKAKCFFGKCICQGNTTGNGKFCRDAVSCSNETLQMCGGRASCLADPLLPHIPNCRCFKGFRLSKEKTCVDVDECRTLKSRCGNRCRNTIGSFYCDKCPRGYIEGRDGVCIASDECDCGENEECYEGECYCKKGYDWDEFGKCVWTNDGLLLSKATSFHALSCLSLVVFGLFVYHAILVLGYYQTA